MERDAEWMIDDVGHEQGGCCLAMTLRDYGRFGQFVLDGAQVDGTPIVPENWLAIEGRYRIADARGRAAATPCWADLALGRLRVVGMTPANPRPLTSK
jgi:CubicO group peptidase (beta-lactamase class C family)